MSYLKSLWRRYHARLRQPFLEDLDRPGARARALIDMNIIDHGLLRRFWTNRHEIAPGIWRGNQPGPREIAHLANLGVRTILNFRGKSQWGSYILEAEACRRHGIVLHDIKLLSRAAPEKKVLLSVLDTFAIAQTPLFMHCKSGADRAGLGAALYLLWAGHPPSEAQAMLDTKYLHFAKSKTGILDAFVAAYARAHAATGIPLRDWIEGPYDPEALAAGFHATPSGTILVDWILRRE